MSENITHTALCDDCLRLLQASPDICDTFKKVAAEHHDFARLGGITRKGDWFTVDLLEHLQEHWAARKPEDLLERKLAFVLGWLSHRAADRRFKPVYRELCPNSTEEPTECGVYHDAYIFRHLYMNDPESPYNHAIFERQMQSLPAATKLNTSQLIDLARTLVQARLIELHTVIPDSSDIHGWLENLHHAQQKWRVDLDRYAAAIAAPDPDKVRAFIDEITFYAEDDRVVATARCLQNGRAIEPKAFRESLEAEPAGQYGQALKMAFEYALAAGEFFIGGISRSELEVRLHIGEPGRDHNYPG
jgi:hypothetical protein